MGMMIQQLARSRMRSYPENLFRGGAVGAWFDPSDFSTMFQDAAGTTPVTALGQPVALILDKSQRLELGTEKFANQAITSIDSAAGAATYTTDNAARTLTVTAAGSSMNYPRMFVDLGLTVGKTYLITGRIDGDRTKLTSPYVRLASSGTLNSLAYNSTTGEFSGRVEAAATGIQFLYNGTQTGTFTVATISCKELKGNHARQASATTSRPTIEARVNRLQASENLSDGYWSKSGCSISNDTVSTYDKIVESSGGTFHSISASHVVIGASQRLSFSAVPAGRNWVWCQVGLAVAYFDLANGVLGTVSGSLSASIAPDPEGGYRCTVTHSNPTTTTLVIGVASGNSSSSYSGDGSSGISVGKIQLAFNDDPFKAVYQRVNTATDYTDIGAPRYLSFDGTDDWLETDAINMTGTDSMVAVAGVRKNSDATLGIIYEFSANTNSNNGAFYLVGPGANGAASYGYVSKGTQVSGSSVGSLAAPISNVTRLVAKVSTDTSILRVNGVPTSFASGDQGTGNYGNHKLYIGRRGGSSLPFNGRLYGLTIVGALQSDAIVSALEKHMAMKTGVTW